MLNFIPAWYKENKWCENEQAWYSRRMYSEFDETIKQIQLFHRNFGIKYRILVLGYSPNLRHFLHRQGMMRAEYWSCFDAIQQITRSKVAVLSYHDLKWPKGIEFVYSPFAIVAFLRGEKYAKLEFGEDGNLISIDMYANEIICRRNYYDDRGFVSSTIVFENGNMHHQDYLSEDGTWRIRVMMSDGHVEINPNHPRYSVKIAGKFVEREYKNRIYPSLEAVIEEVFCRYIAHFDGKDKYFIPLHEQHISLLSRCLVGRNNITTIFENRYDYNKLSSIKEFIFQCDYLITDSKYVTKLVKEKLGSEVETAGCKCIIKDISPYDARLDLGISQQLKVQNIMLPIDGIEDERLDRIVIECAKYLKTNKKARIVVFSRSTDWGLGERTLRHFAKLLDANGFDGRWAFNDKDTDAGENRIDSIDRDENVELRFFMNQAIDERNISKCVNEQRVILDLRNTMDVFLFVTAISKGIPRISSSKDEFFLHKRSGYQITKLENIPAILSYYLDNMENWNAALIENYEIGLKYSTNILIDAWKEVLEISE